MTPAARWALRAYPPSFRDRYGDELAALAEDVTPSWRHTADLYAGAGRAWLRPAFTGPDSTRRRLQASVSTVWVAWCAAFLLAPAVDKALLDPPGPGVDATVRRLLDVSVGVLVAGWLVALAAAALIVRHTLVPALRARRWAVLLPLLPAVVLGIVEAIGLVALALTTPSHASELTPAMVAAGVAWLVGLLAFLVSSGFGPAVTIRQLHPDTGALRVPTLLAAALSLCLAAMTATCAAAVLIAGDASLIGTFAPVAVVVAVGVLASSTALVSSIRGVLALRARA
jgi:hypothetical protein